MPVTNLHTDKEQFRDFLQNLKKKDEKAWAQLNFVLTRVVMKWLHKKNIQAEPAREIYNNAMVVLVDKINDLNFETYTSLKSYVFAITDNKLKEYYRQKTKENYIESLEEKANLGYLKILPPDDLEEKTLAKKRINNLLNELSYIERQLIILSYKKDMTHKETAKYLGINTGNVRVIKHRALEKLRKLYNGNK
jgi:RNA polymerase sigma factor (sigma-70 family)